MEREWPKNGDIFYWIRSDIGDICKSIWIDNAQSNEFRWSIGNVFRTKTEAKLALAERQAKVQDRRIANGR